MPRTKKDQVEEDLFSSTPDEISEVLAGLPSQDTVINLWRVLPQGGPSYVAEFTPSDFSIEAVKNSYGGGRYKIIAKSGGEVRTSIFNVDGDPLTAPRKVYKRYINGKLVFSKPDDADVIIADNARDLKQANDIGNGNQNVMLLLLTEIRSLREAVQGNGSGKDRETEFLEKMTLYKNLFAPKENQIQDFPKIAMDLIKQGMDVAGAAENGGSPWMMVLDKIMPIVQDVLKVVQVQQSRPIPVNGAPMPNQPRAVELPRENLTGFDAIAEDLKPYLPAFIRSASAGVDPAIMIDMTLSNIPEPQFPTVLEWLKSDNYFTDLCKLHPAISAQAGWWNDFRDGLVEAILSPESSHEMEPQ
jgi:hypothetical protein